MITKDIILIALSIVLFISLVVNAHLAEQNSTMKIMIVNLWNLKQEMYELSRKGAEHDEL